MAHFRILFVCTHNGARSRIAEEFAQLLAAGQIEVCSAGFESEHIGCIPISIMKEIGIELSSTPSKSIFKRFKDKECYDYVIAICDPFSSEQISVFLSNLDFLYFKTSQRLNWMIPNFRSLSGTHEEKIEQARQIRDQIKAEVSKFLSQIGIESDSG